MKDPQIDRLLEEAGGASAAPLDATLRARLAARIPSPLQPVRPLPPAWILTCGVVLVCAAVGIAGAARAGLYGIERLGPWAALPILAVLALLAWLAGEKLVAEMIPGRAHRLSPGALPVIVSGGLLAVFALRFTDYHTDQFLSAGLICLFTGLAHAVPTAVLLGILLRRGFAVSSVFAGLAGGALAGLAGVTMLELHCANFQALHVLVWHTAVVPVSAAAGAAVGWAVRWREHDSR